MTQAGEKRNLDMTIWLVVCEFVNEDLEEMQAQYIYIFIYIGCYIYRNVKGTEQDGSDPA